MKIIKFLIIFFLTTNCQKIMHDQYIQIAEINSVSKMNSALVGSYSALYFYFNHGFSTTFMPGGSGIIPMEFSDDFSLVPYMVGDKLHAYTFGSNASSENDIWQGLYKVIICSNNIICQFENNNNINPTLMAGIGEAYFLRAYAYFNLVRIFNQVPLIINLNVNYAVNNSSAKVIYSQIESDLLKAINYLPNNRTTARFVTTPHRGTAKAVLAEVYLTMGGYPINDASKYSLAADMAKEVIDSSVYFGFELLPDFANLWDGTQNINNEEVFGLYFTTFGQNINHGLDYELNNLRAFMYKDFYTNTNIMNIYNYVSPLILANVNFYNNYPVSYRRNATFQSVLPNIYPSWYNIFNNGPGESDSIKFYNYQFADNLTPIWYKKFGYYISADTTTIIDLTHPSINDLFDTVDYLKLYKRIVDEPIYIFRYAHTLLTYAEAKARSGQLDASCYEAVNKIRRRAYKLDINIPSQNDLQSGLSAAQFCDSVIRERELELCGEYEGRWFDLLRLQMVDQLPTLRGGGPPTANFAAIPPSEIVLDPNLGK